MRNSFDAWKNKFSPHLFSHQLAKVQDAVLFGMSSPPPPPPPPAGADAAYIEKFRNSYPTGPDAAKHVSILVVFVSFERSKKGREKDETKVAPWLFLLRRFFLDLDDAARPFFFPSKPPPLSLNKKKTPSDPHRLVPKRLLRRQLCDLGCDPRRLPRVVPLALGKAPPRASPVPLRR